MFLLSDTQSRVCTTLGSCVVFHSVIRGGLRGMREPLSARGRDRDLIRPSVYGDQGARVNQRQTDPSSPWGFTRLDPDTLSLSVCRTKTHTLATTYKSTNAHSHLHSASATPSVHVHTLFCYCFKPL